MLVSGSLFIQIVRILDRNQIPSYILFGKDKLSESPAVHQELRQLKAIYSAGNPIN